MKKMLVAMTALAALTIGAPAIAKGGSDTTTSANARVYTGRGGPLETVGLRIGDKVGRTTPGLYPLGDRPSWFYDLFDRYLLTDGQLVYDIDFNTMHIVNIFELR